MQHHDWIHYFTIFMIFFAIPGGLLYGIGLIIWNSWHLYLDLSGRNRLERMRGDFRLEYAAWKRAEREHDGCAYIHRDNAELAHASLKNLGV